MRGSLLCVLWLAACYDPGVPAGAPCMVDGPCPDGQLCVNGVCTASSSLPPGDRDGDGRADDRDNCASVTNPEQLNEDGDRFGDACDPCPHIADDAPRDSDGDGLSDACDPNPVGGIVDSRWQFDGFHQLPRWTISPGWIVAGDGDNLRVASPGVNDVTEFLTVPLFGSGRTSFANFTASIAVVFDGVVGPTQSNFGFNAYDRSQDKSMFCHLYQPTSNAGDRRLLLLDTLAVNNQPPFAWQNATRYILTLDARGGQYTCSVVGPSGQQTATSSSPLTVQDGNSLAIIVYGVSVRVDWVWIAGTP